MKKRFVLTMILVSILANMLSLTFNIKPVKASGTICITADGSIEPSTRAQMDGVVDINDLAIVGQNYGQTFSLLSLTGILAVVGIHTCKTRKQPK